MLVNFISTGTCRPAEEGRLRLLHAQGDRRGNPRRWPTHCSVTSPAATSFSTSNASLTRNSADRQGLHRRLRHRLPLRAAGQSTPLSTGRAFLSGWNSPAVPLPRPGPDRSTLVIAISQSGETADHPRAVRHARRRRPRYWRSTAPTAARSLAGPTPCSTRAGPEIGVAATRASFLAQVARNLSRRPGAGRGTRYQEYPTRSRREYQDLEAMPDLIPQGSTGTWTTPPTSGAGSRSLLPSLFLGFHVRLPGGAGRRAGSSRNWPTCAAGFAAGTRAQARSDSPHRGGPAEYRVMPSPKNAAMLLLEQHP